MSHRIFGPGEMMSNNNPYGGAPPRPTRQPPPALASTMTPFRPSVNVEQLQAELAIAKREIEHAKKDGSAIAQVAEIRGDRMVVVLGPGMALDVERHKDARVGDRVLCYRNTMQAHAVIADDVPMGAVVNVARQVAGVVEAVLMSTERAFRAPLDASDPSGYHQYRKGERIVVDATMQFVIGSLGMPPPAYEHTPAFSVSWDDVGGQEEAKAALREAIELPFLHPELFRAYGKRATRGVLMHGPSGTGKTLCAKAAASGLARAHGQTHVKGWFYTKGPEILNKYIGSTEESIRGVFAAGRRHYAEHKYPAVWFIDECDALLATRTKGENTSFNQTVVPQFLAEMDGMDESTMLIILATNRPDVLDPAVTRDGRVDRKVHVTRPTRVDAEKIFAIHLRNKPVSAGVDKAAAIATAAREMFDDARTVTLPGTTMKIPMRALVSGAMIEGVVNLATSFAIERDIASASKAKASGITGADLVAAIGKQQDQLRHMSLEEAAREAMYVVANQAEQGE